MADVVLDAAVLADFLASQSGRDRYWSVDGDDALLDQVALPCRGDELAEVVRRHGGRVTVTVPPGKPAPQKVTADNLEQLSEAGHDGAPVFKLAWSPPGVPWILVEDKNVAEESVVARA